MGAVCFHYHVSQVEGRPVSGENRSIFAIEIGLIAVGFAGFAHGGVGVALARSRNLDGVLAIARVFNGLANRDVAL